MFEINEVIICIDDTISAEQFSAVFKLYPVWIKKGKEYTIRDIFYNEGIVTGILLQEVHNPSVFIRLLNRIQEPAFAMWRFRKRTYQEIEAAQEKEQQQEVFIETFLN